MALTQVQTELIATNAISGTVIADNAITSVHIAQNAILTQHIDDGQVNTDQLAADAVTGAKLADSSIVTANIQDDQVTSDKLANNINIAGTLASTGVLTANAGVVVDNITIDGTEIDLSSGDLTLDVAGRIDLSADDNGEIRLYDGSSMYAQFKDDSDRLSIQGLISDADMLFVINDGGSATTALKIDAADGGDALFYGDVQAPGIYVGSTNTSYDFYNNGTSYLNGAVTIDDDLTITNATARAYITSTGAGNNTALVLQADSADTTAENGGVYYVASDTADSSHLSLSGDNANYHLSVTHGGKVGIGTTSPDGKLSVTSTGNASEDVLYLKSGADNVNEYLGIAFETAIGGNGPHGAVRVYNGPSANDSYMSLLTTTDGGTLTQGLTQDHLGNVGIGTTSPDYNLEVEFAAGNHTGGPAITNSQAGGYGSALNFQSERSDTNAHQIAARIRTEGADSWNSDASIDSNLKFDLISANALATKMTITHDGKVGIGTTSPSHKLEVSDSAVASKYDADHHVAIRGLSGGQYIQFSSQGALSFVQVDTYPNSSATEIVRMQSSGFSIGSGAIASHGDQMLRVVGDKNGYAMYLNNSRSTADQPQGLLIDTSNVSSDNNSQVFLKCDDSSAARMQVFTDGDVWTSDAGTLSSDETLKTDIADATSKLSDINNLRVRNFKWKTDYHPKKQHKHIGFIAQEFETVFPALVVENNIARHDETPNMKKGIKQGGLIPILVKCVQELSAKNDALEARIKTLEG